ncbi:unnamed protein product [Rodentolepis nana]|uniref:DUF4038 domain-containing protein n=1 Tax=Rodentolepis nana TaxID=102285 RepID=A0A0R3T0R9_RODNA|nr:unnamed protein product [Rodentolepis nana]
MISFGRHAYLSQNEVSKERLALDQADILLVLSIVNHCRYQDENANYHWVHLLNCSYNSYEVVMHCYLIPSQVVPKKIVIFDGLIFNHGAESKELIFEELKKFPDSQYKRDFDRIYPQVYDISSIIEEIG